MVAKEKVGGGFRGRWRGNAQWVRKDALIETVKGKPDGSGKLRFHALCNSWGS
jgi:hypothetical protein